MWERTYSKTTNAVTAGQMWRLYADVGSWHEWDSAIQYARLEGDFRQGNFYILKPKKGPQVRIELTETEENRRFVDVTRFPGAYMTGVHLFEETSDGLKITTTMRMTGILGFLWRLLIAQGIVDALPQKTERQISHASRY